MSKRIIAIFSICMVMLCGLSMRILSVGAGDYAKTASYNNSRTLTVAKSRGNIYDCNMNLLVNAQSDYSAVLKPTAAALNSIKPYVGAERMAELRSELSKGLPCVQHLPQLPKSGKDLTIAEYKKRYADKQYAAHLIGYVDGDGNGVSGLEKSYNDYLTENGGVLKAAFYVDALGRNLAGAEVEILDDDYAKLSGIVLTIDYNIQKTIEDVLDKYGWESGCAVAMDPNTGEIKAMVSRPNYDPNNVAESLNASNSPLLNKTLLPYSVGSTFKAVVAAAALDQDLTNADFVDVCTGRKVVDGNEFGCFSKTAHGEQNMEQALIHSCNTYFISLGNKIGAEPIISLAEDLGFGDSFNFAPGLSSKAGNLPDISSVKTDGDLANVCFGQGRLLATPLQMATAFSAFANGGYRINPYLLKGYADEDGNVNLTGSGAEHISSRRERVLKASTTDALSKMLTSVVNANDKAKPEKVTAAGKTATAQTGQYKDGEEICHTWFAGWYPVESPKLVIVLMKESGITGISDCGPVFKNIIDTLER